MAAVDFFFFHGSTYTYLTVMRIENVAKAAGVEVRWRPFNVRVIMNEQKNIPFAEKPVKRAYMWRDVQRRARRHRLEWNGHPPYPIDPDLLVNRIGLLAAEEGWGPQYSKAAYRRWAVDHVAIGPVETVEPILTALGQDTARVIAAANSKAIRDRFDAETDEARRLGIFGSPTFAVDKEIFWGDDRLEEALEWAKSSTLEGSRT